MSKWRTVTLGELLRRSAETVDPKPDVEYSQITVRLWGNGVVERDRVLGASVSSRRFLARRCQFIVSRIDARNGAFGLVPESLDGAIVTNDFPLFDLNRELLEPSFLGWLSRTASFVELCLKASEGTTNRVRLKEDRFLALEIPLPSLTEQHRIVTRIEKLAAQINEARSLRQQAAEEARHLWRRSAERVFDQLIEDHSMHELSNLVSIRGGGTPAKSNPSYWDGNIPWITPKDMKVRELDDAIDHVSESATRETAAKLLPAGAVLVVVRGMILAYTFPSALLRAPAAINQDMKALVPNGKVLPEFLCAFFWALNPRFIDLVEKSTHDTRKLVTSVLLDTKVPVPTIPQQRRIVDELNNIQSGVDALKRLQAETTVELDALLPAILDKAFKGEL